MKKRKISFDILLGMRNEVSIISQSLQIHIADMDKYIDSIYVQAEENHIQLLGAPSVLFLDEEFNPDNSNIELMIPK
ncbi:hypothetical protein [Brevibacillus porteri]|uniref:hypothetical protein n=2 Tax=Brevibacillus porteri TaxID=2126350 RepID=UPI001FC9B552|nr:hypothetical protein [Brevibacillus porteri]MED2743066.1 hypothetical protein [Brevibacillus porteri]MED2817781.1 hypothetical protein [Brevibacillus porteri]MED4893722.1 hypothetical protein [Brevibacillus porteri]